MTVKMVKRNQSILDFMEMLHQTSDKKKYQRKEKRSLRRLHYKKYNSSTLPEKQLANWLILIQGIGNKLSQF